jgi:hypothetical protein
VGEDRAQRQYVHGFISEDGINWGTPVGQVSISMTSQVFIGLALTSHNNTQVATAQIGNVSVNSAAVHCGYVGTSQLTGTTGPATGSLEVSVFPNPTDGMFRRRPDRG